MISRFYDDVANLLDDKVTNLTLQLVTSYLSS
jgi:hypothetical protein